MLNNLSELTAALPDMLSGDELIQALADLPLYDEQIIYKSKTERLLALSDLYRIYIPSFMSTEIYSKLYVALIRSLEKKGMKLAIRQKQENHLAVKGQEYRGIIGGSDSFTIIGGSGIGKSSAIDRAISLITGNQIIEVGTPYCKIIPCLVVQCPFDASVKSMLLEILRKVDETLETKYYDAAIRARSTTDMLIGSVSQVCLNHVGMLIVDEIQNVVNSKNGKILVGSLTQLINNSGISICMVGTPDCTVFFEGAMHLARRSLGLKYQALPYDEYFVEICKMLFGYTFVNNTVPLDQSLINWLYEHCNGIMAVLVALLHDAQEIAILTGAEMLDRMTLDEAFKQRLCMMHDYIRIEEPIKQKTQPKKKNVWREQKTEPSACNRKKISLLVDKAKSDGLDIVELLKVENLIMEVTI